MNAAKEIGPASRMRAAISRAAALLSVAGRRKRSGWDWLWGRLGHRVPFLRRVYGAARDQDRGRSRCGSGIVCAAESLGFCGRLGWNLAASSGWSTTIAWR